MIIGHSDNLEKHLINHQTVRPTAGLVTSFWEMLLKNIKVIFLAPLVLVILINIPPKKLQCI